jgi:hypothetical protein
VFGASALIFSCHDGVQAAQSILKVFSTLNRERHYSPRALCRSSTFYGRAVTAVCQQIRYVCCVENWGDMRCGGTLFPVLLCSAASIHSVKFEVFTAVTMKNGVFWDVTPCGSGKNRRFGGT